MLVAPVTIGDGAYTAAGSVITKTFLRGRWRWPAARQRNIEGWVARKRPGTAAAQAALRRAEPGSRRATRVCGARGRRHAKADKPPDGEHGMSGIKTTGEKKLMFFSGRAYPELAEEVAEHLGCRDHPDEAARLRQRRDLRPLPGVGPGLRRVRHPEPHGSDQQVDHGAADHGGRAQAGVGQADHRDHAVLRLRPAGQEAAAAASRSRRG